MPHQSLKLTPGVDQNKTPALNEAAISTTNLVRFIPDRNGIGLVQKLGGWTRFYNSDIGSIPRALWAWEDLNVTARLAIGSETGLSIIAWKAVVSDRSLNLITPQTTTAGSVTLSFSTTINSYIVQVNITGSGLDAYDAVDLKTQVSIGGIILFGVYQVYQRDTNSFYIHASDALGNPQYATATTAAAAVPSFSTESGKAQVSVSLANHGLFAGDTFPVLVPTTVGGITLFGNYIVTSVVNTNNFIIVAENTASSTTTGSPVSENGGYAYFVYYNGIGPLPKSTGYGVGGYGAGGYGTGVAPTASTGTPITAVDWTLDNWGETLIACPLDGPVYQWSPTTNNPIATIIPTAPQVNAGMVVAMPQRQIIAWGSTFNGIQDPLLIRWCEVNDFSVWAVQITNQAGSYRIPKGSRIVQCIQGPQQTLVWTDLALWAMQYVGPPYVYQFNEIGTGCGLIGRKAATSMGGVVYWMGQSQFYRLSGGGVETIACPVWDVIFQDLDTENLGKIRVAPNSRFGEISWYYPTKGNGGEVSHYVKYNILLNQWDFGELSRTAWINESVLGPPIGGSPTKLIYQHETSTDGDGSPINSSFQTGYFALTDADVKMFIDQIWPDMKWGYYGGTQNASVQLTFYVADYPGQTPTTHGPFTMTQATTFLTPRLRGRLVSIKVESSDMGSFWRLGNIRYRIQQDGKY